MDVNQEESDNLARRPNNRLSGINQRLLNAQRQFQFAWQRPKEQLRLKDLHDPPAGRLIVDNAILAFDLVFELIRQEFNELRPRLPRIDFGEYLEYARQNLPQIVMDRFNQLLNWLFPNNKPRALHGRDALLHTDLLRYKQPGSFDDTDTDDAISLGDSTIAASDRMRTIELEQELAKIKDNMSSVFEAKIAEMQSTINKQAEAQAEMQAKMNEMMEQFKAANLPSSAKKPTTSSYSSVARCPPPAPPLPPQLQTPKFGQDRTNLMDSIRAAGGFASSGLKHIDNSSHPKPNYNSQPVSLKSSKESAPTSNNQSLGYDYRNELAVQLQKRRQAIERNENFDFTEAERETKSNGNPLVASMLKQIPVQPSSPASSRLSATNGDISCNDEDEWN